MFRLSALWLWFKNRGSQSGNLIKLIRASDSNAFSGHHCWRNTELVWLAWHGLDYGLLDYAVMAYQVGGTDTKFAVNPQLSIHSSVGEADFYVISAIAFG